MSDIGMETEFQVAGWRVICRQNGALPPNPDWQRELASLLPRLQCPDVVLKHDHRSLVGYFQLNGEKFAVKQFMLQHTWLWFQWTSILFPSLGEIAFRNALGLLSDGIATPAPVLLLQRRKFGMVRDAWLVYRYLEGTPLAAADGAALVAFLRRMHDAGWVHRDPHPANFIGTPNGVATIDPIKARHRRNRYLCAYDVMLASQNIPDAPDLYGRAELGIWLTLAQQGHSLVRLYRVVKHAIRKPFLRRSPNALIAHIKSNNKISTTDSEQP